MYTFYICHYCCDHNCENYCCIQQQILIGSKSYQILVELKLLTCEGWLYDIVLAYAKETDLASGWIFEVYENIFLMALK